MNFDEDQSAKIPSNGEQVTISWRWPLGMIGLSFFNFVMRILTLSIYDFWGRTEVRKRLWSSVRLNGEPLIYTGTGKELFLGFLIVFAIVLLPLILASFGVVMLFGPRPEYLVAFQICVSVCIFFLFGIAVYRAQRYRLARTNWRGIRGSLTGSPLGYAWTYFWTALLIPMTLGWILPWRATKLQSIITNETKFGDRSFSFKGTAGPLYGPFAAFWCGAFFLYIIGYLVFAGLMVAIVAAVGAFPEDHAANQLTLGVKIGIVSALVAGALIVYLLYLTISTWYRAKMVNHFARSTKYDGAPFKGSLSGLGLLWIDFSNFLILALGVLLVLTPLSPLLYLGFQIVKPAFDAATTDIESNLETIQHLVSVSLAILFFIIAISYLLFVPITQARSMGYFVSHLSLEGDVPLSEIAQGADQDLKVGEGLAHAFDVDAL